MRIGIGKILLSIVLLVWIFYSIVSTASFVNVNDDNLVTKSYIKSAVSNTNWWRVFVTFIILAETISHFFYIDIKNKNNILEKNIIWNSMLPMLESGEKIKLVVWYYKNYDLEYWDLVAYNFSWNNKNIYIKILKAKPNDYIEFKNNNIFINWKEMKNSIWEKYFFSKEEQNLMKLFIKNQKLKKWSYFIFWDNVKFSIDSRKFWWVWKKDFIWKFLKWKKKL